MRPERRMVFLAAACSALIPAILVSFASGSAARVLVGGDQQKVSLGTGYDDVSRRMLDVCVEGKVAKVGGGTGWLKSDSTKELETMRRDIDGYASAGVDVGIFGAGGAIEYIARTSRESLRQGVLLEFQAQVGSFVLRPNVVLNPTGRSVAAMSDLYGRRLRCGTEFVWQVDVGYRLRIALTATFQSRSSYEKFRREASVSALFGMFHHSWESVSVIQTFGQDVVLEASALQEGGKQERLERILEGKTLCTGADIEACSEMVRQLLEYASSPDGFRAEMIHADVYDPADPHGPAVLRYVTSTYEDAGIEAMRAVGGPPSPIIALGDARRRMEGVLAALASDQQRATALSEMASLGQGRRAALRDLAKELSALLVTTRAALAECESPDLWGVCVERATDIERRFHAIDRLALDA